ncbi:uncharacterized protein BDZ99DRAFT_575506 [Mytilinidion resinicola]|uniref:SLIDE domain-containing protein n=1 Tax=Mytilinidion resinicola TaxID=574789 RepID=A0A6A6Y6M9_9PEZI|nr:uncharacterized protein BDZ99DRAFT_575506 [Mytilinidion resinicola]KAF2804259.1 hypothetical protein BDZ99DRAFT_575506 [Mytilinidion resinicola]
MSDYLLWNELPDDVEDVEDGEDAHSLAVRTLSASHDLDIIRLMSCLGLNVSKTSKSKNRGISPPPLPANVPPKASSLRAPPLAIQHTVSTTNKKVYTEEEDRFLLIQIDKYGIESDGIFEKIRDDIRESPLVCFDWFFLSEFEPETMTNGRSPGKEGQARHGRPGDWKDESEEEKDAPVERKGKRAMEDWEGKSEEKMLQSRRRSRMASVFTKHRFRSNAVEGLALSRSLLPL